MKARWRDEKKRETFVQMLRNVRPSSSVQLVQSGPHSTPTLRVKPQRVVSVETRKKISESVKRNWQDEAYASKVRKAMAKVRSRLSARFRVTRFWGWRRSAHILRKLQQVNQSPERRKQLSEALKAKASLRVEAEAE